jgi:hypothetical protein
MPKFSFTTRFAIFPHSFVTCSIWPFLYTVPMFLVAFPLALINCSILENNFFSCL